LPDVAALQKIPPADSAVFVRVQAAYSGPEEPFCIVKNEPVF